MGKKVKKSSKAVEKSTKKSTKKEVKKTKEQVELEKHIKSLNKLDDVDIALTGNYEEMLEEFMDQIEALADDNELGSVPKAAIKFYEARAAEAQEEDGEDEEDEEDSEEDEEDSEEDEEEEEESDSEEDEEEEEEDGEEEEEAEEDSEEDEEDEDTLEEAFDECENLKDLKALVKEHDIPVKIKKADKFKAAKKKVAAAIAAMGAEEEEEEEEEEKPKGKGKGKAKGEKKSSGKPSKFDTGGALSVSSAVAKAFKALKGKKTTLAKIATKANDFRVNSGGADNKPTASGYIKVVAESLEALGLLKKQGKNVTIGK